MYTKFGKISEPFRLQFIRQAYFHQRRGAVAAVAAAASPASFAGGGPSRHNVAL
jgi:hypothetical protein